MCEQLLDIQTVCRIVTVVGEQKLQSCVSCMLMALLGAQLCSVMSHLNRALTFCYSFNMCHSSYIYIWYYHVQAWQIQYITWHVSLMVYDSYNRQEPDDTLTVDKIPFVECTNINFLLHTCTIHMASVMSCVDIALAETFHNSSYIIFWCLSCHVYIHTASSHLPLVTITDKGQQTHWQ